MTMFDSGGGGSILAPLLASSRNKRNGGGGDAVDSIAIGGGRLVETMDADNEEGSGDEATEAAVHLAQVSGWCPAGSSDPGTWVSTEFSVDCSGRRKTKA